MAYKPMPNGMIPLDSFAAVYMALWLWLAANPGHSPNDWPKWRHNGGPIPSCVDFQPECEYVRIIAGLRGVSDSCSMCPVHKAGSCLRPSSPYMLFIKALRLDDPSDTLVAHAKECAALPFTPFHTDDDRKAYAELCGGAEQ